MNYAAIKYESNILTKDNTNLFENLVTSIDNIELVYQISCYPNKSKVFLHPFTCDYRNIVILCKTVEGKTFGFYTSKRLTVSRQHAKDKSCYLFSIDLNEKYVDFNDMFIVQRCKFIDNIHIQNDWLNFWLFDDHQPKTDNIGCIWYAYAKRERKANGIDFNEVFGNESMGNSSVVLNYTEVEIFGVKDTSLVHGTEKVVS